MIQSPDDSMTPERYTLGLTARCRSICPGFSFALHFTPASGVRSVKFGSGPPGRLQVNLLLTRSRALEAVDKLYR